MNSFKLSSLLCLFMIIPLFQNCGRPFELAQLSNLPLDSNDSANNGSSTEIPSETFDGKALYAANCAGCHNDLATSTKLGKKATEINAAILFVPQMKAQTNLLALNSSEVQAIDDALNGRITTTPSGSSSTPVGACLPTAVRGISKEAVRRLSRDELQASMTALFPNNVFDLNNLFSTYPDTDVVEEVEKYDPLHSLAQVTQWADIVDATIDSINKRGTLTAIGGSCLGQSTISESCWRTFFTDFGKKVYRRHLAANEISKLMSLTQTRTSSADQVYAAFHLLLRSPAFLFHFETGVSEESSRVRLSDFEVANRISFAILGTPPDTLLAQAAERGELKTLAQVENQVKRLIELDAAKLKLKKFFSEWLQLSKVQIPQQEFMAFFKELGNGGGVDKAMRQEIQDYVFYIIWKKKGSFRDLMTANIAFPRFQGLMYQKNSAPFSVLAQIYGGDPFTNFTPENQAEANPYPAPNNPGLITRAGFLTTSRWETQPIARGVFIQRRILCESLPSPDFSIVNQRLSDVGELDHLKLANYEMTSIRTSGTACVACHSKINPMGFALEQFDMIGQLRQEEQVLDINQFYSAKKGIIATHPIPSTVANVQVGERTTSVSSAADLANQIASSTRAKMCLSSFILRHFDRRKENGGDSCALAEATKMLDQDQPILGLFVKSLANDDIFWRRK